MKRDSVIGCAILVGLALAVPSSGEVPIGEPGFVPPAATNLASSDDSRSAPETYGGASRTAVTHGSYAFTPLQDGSWNHLTNGWSSRTSGANTATCTALHLPSGALLEAITTFTDDTDPTFNVQYFLFTIDLATSTGGISFSFATTGTPGIQRVLHTLVTPITINNDRRSYALCVLHAGTTSATQHGGATFWYRLQVSPAPATATFPNDVPTSHALFRFVEALAASGITGGCGAGSFCPDAPLTRGQMAVFLAAALGLHFPN